MEKNMEKINEGLKKYIEDEILPQYDEYEARSIIQIESIKII